MCVRKGPKIFDKRDRLDGYPSPRLSLKKGDRETSRTVLRLTPPNPCPQRFADAKPNTHRNAHNQHANQYLDQDSVPLAEALQAGTAVLVLTRRLGFPLPVVLPRPHVAVGAAARALDRLARAVR